VINLRAKQSFTPMLGATHTTVGDFEGAQGRHLYSRLNFKLKLVVPAKWLQLLSA
jgi:hypothetical protein